MAITQLRHRKILLASTKIYDSYTYFSTTGSKSIDSYSGMRNFRKFLDFRKFLETSAISEYFFCKEILMTSVKKSCSFLSYWGRGDIMEKLSYCSQKFVIFFFFFDETFPSGIEVCRIRNEVCSQLEHHEV